MQRSRQSEPIDLRRRKAPVLVLLLAIAAFMSPKPAVPAASYRFTPGEIRVYRLEYSSASESNPGALFEKTRADAGAPKAGAPSARALRSQLRGELFLTTLQVTPKNVTLAIAVREAEVKIASGMEENAAQDASVRDGLGRVTFVDAAPNGRFVSIRFDPATSRLARGFAHALLGAMQFVLPDAEADSPLERWETEEVDANGRYRARYERDGSERPSGGIAAYRKEKLRYLRQDQAPSPGRIRIQPEIEAQTNLRGRFDVRDGYLVSLAGSESQRVLLAGSPIAETEWSIRLVELRRESLDAAALRALRDGPAARAARLPMGARRSSSENRPAIERTALRGATLGDLLEELDRLDRSPSPDRDDTQLFLKFKALLYLSPESAEPIASVLQKAPSGGTALRLLAPALASADNELAQKALGAVAAARAGDSAALAVLIPALASIQRPTTEVERTLRRLALSASDTAARGAAQLALGSIVRTVDPDSARRIVDWVLAQLEPAGPATRHWLAVLGNTGSARALPALRHHLASPLPEVRASAASALRWIDDTAAEEALLDLLARDKEDSVRAEAIVALGFRTPSKRALDAQCSALRNDPAVSVRLAAIENLARQHGSPHELFAAVAANDAALEVREAAARLLERR